MPTNRDELGPIEVRVEDENVTKALKVLRKEIGKEGIIKKMKEKQFYTKPSKKEHNKKRKKQRERQHQED